MKRRLSDTMAKVAFCAAALFGLIAFAGPAAAQELDLCALLGEATPNEADPEGLSYAFEKGPPKPPAGAAGPMCGSATTSPLNTRARMGARPSASCRAMRSPTD